MYNLEDNARKLLFHHIITVRNICSSRIDTKGCILTHFLSTLDSHFIESNSLLRILCKHSMHIHMVNIFIYVYL